jgi:hypothetical protein
LPAPLYFLFSASDAVMYCTGIAKLHDGGTGVLMGRQMNNLQPARQSFYSQEPVN